jgi:MFS family permease
MGTDEDVKGEESHDTDGSSENIKPSITTDEAVEQVGFGLFHLLLTVFAGLNWFMAGFLILILSILSELLKCEWGLSVEEEALLTSLFFLGILVGSQFWGFMGDRYGRKKAIVLTNGLTSVFGILSSFSPYYGWLLVMRIFTGFSLSGSGVVIVTYLSEFMPRTYRGAAVLSMEVFFAIGGIVVVAIGLFMVPSVGWRWYLFVSALPAVMVTTMSFVIPRSPRHLVLKGKSDAALKVLNSVARFNCRPAIKGPLVIKRGEHKTKVKFIVKKDEDHLSDAVDSEKALLFPHGREFVSSASNTASSEVDSKGFQILPLFQKGMWKTTLLLGFIWPCTMSFIYGSVLLSTSLFKQNNHCGSSDNPLDLDVCKELDLEDYGTVMWTLASEIPGLAIAGILLLCLGRKVVMGIEMFLCAVFVGLLYICLSRYGDAACRVYGLCS